MLCTSSLSISSLYLLFIVGVFENEGNETIFEYWCNNDEKNKMSDKRIKKFKKGSQICDSVCDPQWLWREIWFVCVKLKDRKLEMRQLGVKWESMIHKSEKKSTKEMAVINTQRAHHSCSFSFPILLNFVTYCVCVQNRKHHDWKLHRASYRRKKIE